MKTKRFVSRISHTEFILGILGLFPFYLFGSIYVATALIKVYCLLFNLPITISQYEIVANVIIDTLVIIAFVCILPKYIKANLRDFKRRWHLIIRVGFYCVFLSYLISAIGTGIVYLFHNTTTSQNQTTIQNLLVNIPLLTAISAIFIAPICEELLFRGILFTYFRKYNRFLAYFISSFTFGFLHVYQAVFAGNISEFILLIPYAAKGIAFCYAYEKTDNIFGSITTHMLLNAIATFILI